MARLFILFCSTFVFAHAPEKVEIENEELFSVRVYAKTAEERTQVANSGAAIEAIFSDSVVFTGRKRDIDAVKKTGFKVEAFSLSERMANVFPLGDVAYHDYAETVAALDELASKHPEVATRFSIGKSLEGKELAGIRISYSRKNDSLPTAVLIGCHHAREHLSVEVPLMVAKYLVEQASTNTRIKTLLETREVYIVPMLNPDGAEYDISSSYYRFWRKNRRNNGDGYFGVDLNRNYETGFGGPGSSADTGSDTYHGPNAFSEPETQAVRDFLTARTKTTTLISFHTFSELILWPFGHTYAEIANEKDRLVFETMGKKMAEWNHYKPMKSSGLYLASGDTTDWAYDKLGIFAFTFELSPASMFSGGFYPGASAIEPTFKANLEPTLYLLEKTVNPYEVLNEKTADPLGFLASR